MPIMNCQYLIRTYLLCQSGNCIIRLKPLSTDEQILTVDDRGIYDVISLNILVIIENMMKDELQIQDLFNVVFSTNIDKF